MDLSDLKEQARTEPRPGEEEGGGEPGRDRTETEEMEKLRQELEQLKEEKQELYQQVLRKQADFENYRKRMTRERLGLRDEILGDFFKKMLPLLDNLDRALKSSDHPEGERGLKEGLGMIHKQFLALLKEEGVEEITCTGEAFDPHFHDAVMVVDSPAHRENTVVEELQKGYKLKDKVLRCSTVTVSK